jgi:branched-subunit amino acid transport protein
MAQAVSRRHLITKSWVRARVSLVGVVVDKVGLGQVYLRVLRFSPINIFPAWFSTLINHTQDEQ